MNVTEARRTRNLVIRLDRGEELPSALIRALDEAEARAAWITGTGALESAEILLYDQRSRDLDRTRKIDTPCGVVSLTGNAALSDGALSIRLSATLARETDLGLQLLAGWLIGARAFSLELHVVAFDDVVLLRAPDDRTGLSVLNAQKGAPSLLTEPPRLAAAALPLPHAEAPAPTAQQYPPPSPATEAPVMRQKPVRRGDDVEVYPEAGDEVMHFHFGECTVVSADGDRIRLRQGKDGRVREVSLSMLRIEPPTTTVDSKRHFKLARKN
jgi:predicted DNA-binding protein with PD1-like motif